MVKQNPAGNFQKCVVYSDSHKFLSKNDMYNRFLGVCFFIKMKCYYRLVKENKFCFSQFQKNHFLFYPIFEFSFQIKNTGKLKIYG